MTLPLTLDPKLYSNSYSHHSKWMPEISRYIRKYNKENGTTKVPPVLLVGNKKHMWDRDKVPESSVSDRDVV